jgi:uncharacterized protein YggE
MSPPAVLAVVRRRSPGPGHDPNLGYDGTMTARTVLIVFLAVAALGGCAGPTIRDHDLSDVIAVEGRGTVSVKPDMAIAELGAEARAPQLADATADVARRMTAVIGRVTALGVAQKDITTLHYTVEPVAAPRRGDDGPTRIAGYRVVNVVQVRIRDITTAARILDAAIAEGANTLPSLSFTLADRSAAETQARTLAVKAAAAKAREIADAAGVRLGDLVSLQERAGLRPIAPRAAMATVAAGPVEAGELEVVVTVEARYRIAR